MKSLLLYILFLQVLINLVVCPKCIVQAPDGTTYDLNSLSVISGSDPDDKNPNRWIYTLNLCKGVGFTCDRCLLDSGYCQQSLDKRNTYCVGASSTVSFVGKNGGAGVEAFFVSPPGTDGLVRKGKVIISCNPAASTPVKLDIHNPTNVNSYEITFESVAACPAKALGGLSGGSVFLIIVLCATVVYLIGGVIFLGAVKGQRGKDMIPNLDFWSMVPGLVKDGVLFTIDKIKSATNRN